MKQHRFAVLSLAPCCLLSVLCLSGEVQSQDQIVNGNLTVTEGTILGSSLISGTFEVRPGGIVVGKGTVGSSPLLLSNEQGVGTRLLWHPRKAAFRAGHVSSIQWSESSIGLYSVAFGHNSMAYGIASTAMGSGSMASGNYSTAMGVSFAFGNLSTAMGGGMASGILSTAMGEGSASGLHSTAMAGGNASGNYSIATGMGWAKGMYSMATGETKAESVLSTTFGKNNIGGGHPTEWNPGDPLFEIGNGTDPSNTSNALTIYKNGNMVIQGAITCAPGGDIPMFGE